MKRNSLAFRMFFAVASVALATILLNWAVLYHSMLGPGAGVIDDELRAAALVVLRSLPSDIDVVRNRTRKSLRSNDKTPYSEAPERFQVWSRDGRMLLRSADAPAFAMDPTQRAGARDTLIDGKRWRVVSIADDDNRVVVQYGVPRSDVTDTLRSSFRDIALILFGIFFVQLLAVLWVVRRTLRPLRALSAALDRRAADAIERVSVKGLPSEIQPVMTSLNGLLARVETLRSNEQRFLAEAAHELRTPLAAMRLQTQAVARIEDRLEQREAIETLLGGIDRTTRLANQMLDYARTEPHTHGNIDRTPCDVDSVVLAAIEGILPFGARERSPVLVYSCHLQATVDAALLELAVRNLVHNALRHAGNPVEVEVRAARSGDTLIVQIRDNGPGITANGLAVEGIWRAPNRGIGLEIVRRVCALHGGELLIEHATGYRGMQPTLRLPDAFDKHVPQGDR